MGAHMPPRSTCADAGRTPSTPKNAATMTTPTEVGFIAGNITTGAQPVRDSTVDSDHSNVNEACRKACRRAGPERRRRDTTSSMDFIIQLQHLSLIHISEPTRLLSISY